MGFVNNKYHFADIILMYVFEGEKNRQNTFNISLDIS